MELVVADSALQEGTLGGGRVADCATQVGTLGDGRGVLGLVLDLVGYLCRLGNSSFGGGGRFVDVWDWGIGGGPW